MRMSDWSSDVCASDLFHEAIQRVYFNIGSCSEQCWVNHLTDLRQLDPQGRNFGQTTFDIAQCRRDCPAFRAIEDRLGDIGAFLLSRRTDATQLRQARDTDPNDLKPDARHDARAPAAHLEQPFADQPLRAAPAPTRAAP